MGPAQEKRKSASASEAHGSRAAVGDRDPVVAHTVAPSRRHANRYRVESLSDGCCCTVPLALPFLSVHVSNILYLLALLGRRRGRRRISCSFFIRFRSDGWQGRRRGRRTAAERMGREMGRIDAQGRGSLARLTTVARQFVVGLSPMCCRGRRRWDEYSHPILSGSDALVAPLTRPRGE